MNVLQLSYMSIRCRLCKIGLHLKKSMANWMLRCQNCSNAFLHSVIAVKGVLDYFLPSKPESPDEGWELECPHCGHKGTYQRSDLFYQP